MTDIILESWFRLKDLWDCLEPEQRSNLIRQSDLDMVDDKQSWEEMPFSSRYLIHEFIIRKTNTQEGSP